MGIDSAIDITAGQRRTILALLERHLPGTAAWVYGSRAKWTSRPQSDLDIVVFAPPEQARRVRDLQQALEESDLPFRVDLFVWDEVSDQFREQIKAEHVVLFTGHQTASKWRSRPLADLVDVRLSSVDKKIAPTESNVLLCNYTDVYYNSFIRADMNFMGATASEREIEKCTLQLNDVIITKDSEKHDDIGVPALVREEIENLVCGYHLAILRPSEHVYGPYLYYTLTTTPIQHQFHAYANGITRFGLRKADIGLVEVPVPSDCEQRAIAHILGTLDEKIELNRRMNETLEAMARALFKSWFVDFDPVRAKMEGRDTGLPQHIADLFPDRLVDSELDKIPEGWEVGCLDDVAGSPRRSVNPTEVCAGTSYIGLEHMPRHSIALTEWESSEKVTSNKSAFRKGEVLFGKLRPYFHKVGLAPVEGICSTDIVVVAPKNTSWSAFVLALVSSVEFVKYTDHTSTGTKMPRTSWKIMSRYEICLPVEPVTQAFQNIVGPMLDRIVANIHSNRPLAALRDMLLPKLVSGEIRVPDAERLVGEIT